MPPRQWPAALLGLAALGLSCKPTQPPDEGVRPPDDGSAHYGDGRRKQVQSQSFVPATSQLTGVALRFRLEQAATGASQAGEVRIRRRAPGGSAGPTLARASARLDPSMARGQAATIEFEFERPVLTFPDDTYVLEWHPPVRSLVAWTYDDGDPYAAGGAFDPAAHDIPLGRDFDFMPRGDGLDPRLEPGDGVAPGGGAGASDGPCPTLCTDGALREGWFDELAGRCRFTALPCRNGCAGATKCAESAGVIRNPTRPGKGCQFDWDEDGVPGCDDLCPDTPADARASVDANGCGACKWDSDGEDPRLTGSVGAFVEPALAISGPGAPVRRDPVTMATDQCVDETTLREVSCELPSSACMGEAAILATLPWLGAAWTHHACVADPAPGGAAGTVTATELECECGCAQGRCDSTDTDHDGEYDCVDVDDDEDLLNDIDDNCPLIPNPDQSDIDRDGLGDVCDPCPRLVDNAAEDPDGDRVCGTDDNCPATPNPDQANFDSDRIGNACDICQPWQMVEGARNSDDELDRDGDEVPDGCDNCVNDPNADQEDVDGDGVGDACDCDDAFRGPTEEDIDCGEACASSCDLVRVTGRVRYREATLISGRAPGAGQDDPVPTQLKPVRAVSILVLFQPLLPGGVFGTQLDDDGRFSLDLPAAKLGHEYTLVLTSENFAADVWADLVRCNEEVYFRSPKRTLDRTQVSDLDLFVSPPGLPPPSVGAIRLQAREFEPTLGCDRSSSSLDGMRVAGAEYLNILECARVVKTFATRHRDASSGILGGGDSLGKVDIAYPQGDGGVYSGTYREVRLSNKVSYEGMDDFIVMHEYQHFVAHEISTANYSYCTEHDDCKVPPSEDEELGFWEGSADFVAWFLIWENSESTDALLRLDDENANTNRNPERACSAPFDVRDQMTTAQLLWDVADDGAFPLRVPTAQAEPLDLIGGQERRVMQILDRELDNVSDAPDICDFRKAWRARVSGTAAAADFETLLGTLGLVNRSC